MLDFVVVVVVVIFFLHAPHGFFVIKTLSVPNSLEMIVIVSKEAVNGYLEFVTFIRGRIESTTVTEVSYRC